MTWQLSTYERNGTSGLAVLRADGSLAGPPELKRWPTMMELLAGWQQAEGVLRGLEVSGAPLVEHDSLLAPVRWPRKVMCAGVNYRRHMREMGGEIPAGGWRPFFFLKAPTTTVIGPGDPIVIRSPEQARYDWEAEDGHRYYTKEAHVADLAGEAIDKLVEFWPDMPMEGEVEIIGLGGAIGDVPEDATAFSNRGYLLWLNFAMRWDDPACDASYMERTRAIVRDLAPWVGKGIYLNMLNFDEMDRVVEALGGPEKYARLGRVKAQYDPGNLFRANYNIVPQPAP